ncbi:MAG: lipid A biosynthesis acyltransferase [Ferruginibacter sp.]|nr:lipid A biosynthesis acyltransferase [Ferruginibacter sp.]
MSAWQGKSRGNKFGYQLFVWILKTFGVLPSYFILRIVAFYFFLFSTKANKNTFYLYRHRLGYGWLKSITKIYTNAFLLGQSIIDKVVLMSDIKNNFTFNFDGEANLREIVALQKGGILLSAHIGTWDIAGHLLKRLNTVINIVIFDGEQAQIKNYMDKITGKKSIKIIVIKNDLSHIYAISDAFKNNELLCMHADRFLEGNKTISTKFLGKEAKFPIGPFVLASTFKVPVSYVFAVKENKLHYHLFASKIKNYDGQIKDIVIKNMLTDYAAEMEIKVKKYPAQWFNYFNFWA